MKKIRRNIAYKIWDFASWLYPYIEFKYDDKEVKLWGIEIDFEGTEKEADEIFERMMDTICGDHHPLDLCVLTVGFCTPKLREIPDEELAEGE